jgi:RNase H-like domain found in reverse transcriptase
MILAETNYDIHDKELLAIVTALQEWRVYLEGSKYSVKILTDHKNLTWFTIIKVLNRR